MREQRRFVFKEKLPQGDGSDRYIPEGSEITIMNEGGGSAVYFNGGLVDTSYQQMLLNLVNNPTTREKYLREIAIPYNRV